VDSAKSHESSDKAEEQGLTWLCFRPLKATKKPQKRATGHSCEFLPSPFRSPIFYVTGKKASNCQHLHKKKGFCPLYIYDEKEINFTYRQLIYLRMNIACFICKSVGSFGSVSVPVLEECSEVIPQDQFLRGMNNLPYGYSSSP